MVGELYQLTTTGCLTCGPEWNGTWYGVVGYEYANMPPTDLSWFAFTVEHGGNSGVLTMSRGATRRPTDRVLGAGGQQRERRHMVALGQASYQRGSGRPREHDPHGG